MEKKMDKMTLELNSPITEEQWDLLEDVDLDNTEHIYFHTKHGKEVEFVKRNREMGHWIEREVIDEPQGKIIKQWQSAKCSVCGKYHTTPYLYNYTHYDFCPSCGAKMER